MTRSKFRNVIILTAAILATVLWIHRLQQPAFPRPVERTWEVMGTFASITLRGDEADHLDRVADETARLLEQFNRLMSAYLPDSDVTRLNGATEPVTLHPETLALLRQSLHYSRSSGGAFDPTAMPLIRLWGFSGGHVPEDLPENGKIEAARLRTGIDKLKPGPDSAYFSEAGMMIDLGGIAKGFAIDRCFDAIISKTPLNMIFNLGGEIRCHGMAAPERNWRIGVQHPLEKDALLGTISLKSGMAVATSGNYERFVTIEGKRYAHIVDPRTGMPVTGMAGVTVVSPDATEADALSTALFVIGVEEAAALLQNYPQSHALLVPDRSPLEIYVSEGFFDVFKPFQEFEKTVRKLPLPSDS